MADVQTLKKIQVTSSSLPAFEEYSKTIEQLWTTKWLTNHGALHNQLKLALQAYLDVNEIALFTNGHAALESILHVLNLTGEIITTPFTFVSTTHAIVRNGLTPVFCDINLNDYTIDVTKIEALITENTAAILPVHVYGNICDVEAIEQLAQQYNLPVIYDAAHAFGVTYKGQSIAQFGDASMFSFHATKVFNTIEGGALVWHDRAMSHQIDAYKNFGITGYESVDYIGTNAKMNEFQAAMGICNLKYVDEGIAKRKQLVARYVENLKMVPGLRFIMPQPNVSSNYAYFPVVFEAFFKTRDEVFEQLARHDIHARKYFYPLTSQLECYKGLFKINDTPVANFIAENVLTLPLYAELTMEDVDRICTIIKS